VLPLHCILHQQALWVKDSQKTSEQDVATATKIVNFNVSQTLNNRQFKMLFDEVN
jgi:hypothetical protein